MTQDPVLVNRFSFSMKLFQNQITQFKEHKSPVLIAALLDKGRDDLK